MTHQEKLQKSLPWIQTPLLVSAPMSGFATSKLAVAVTQAGGLGQIGFDNDLQFLSAELAAARAALTQDDDDENILPHFPRDSPVLPIGLGVIVFAASWKEWAPLLAEYQPAVVWLAFGDVGQMQAWTEGIRAVAPHTQVWVQLGTVRDALEIAEVCAPDALVLQGSDAGGHGTANGGSIVSLVPEVADALAANGKGDIPLIAAGGIVDGRGVAAAVMLGAAGVVMGTRFLVAEETEAAEEYREAVLDAVDGGAATVRSRVFDELRGRNMWPEKYDGRCLRNAAFDDRAGGLSLDEIQSRFQERLNEAQMGVKLETKDVNNVWAGAGAGLLKEIEPAGEIVRKIRLETTRLLEGRGR